MTVPDTLPPELAELGELLREDPPKPSEGWGRRLDERVAAGFPATPRARRRFRLRRPRALLPALGFAASLLLVGVVSLALISRSGDRNDVGTGASGGGSSESAGGMQGEISRGAKEDATIQDAAKPSAGLASPQAAIAPSPGGGDPRSDRRSARRVERSAAVTLAAPRRDVDGVADGIVRVTDAAGGYVASSSVAGDGGSFDLRIPTARLPRALADLSRLAHVRERSQSSNDITAESVSARDRLRAARREREGLLRQLARAVTLNETASIRSRLAIVARELAGARTSVRRVGNRASFANVAVALVAARGSAAAPDDEGAWTPGDAARDAVRVLEVAAGVILVALAVALPILLLAALAWLASRVTVRRRRARALDAA